MTETSVLGQGGPWLKVTPPKPIMDASAFVSEALFVLDKEMTRRLASGERVLADLAPRLNRIQALSESYQRIGKGEPADVELVVNVLAAILGAFDADSTLLQNLSDLLYRSLHHCSPCVADAEPACSVDPANIVGGATDTSPCVGAVGVREHAAPTESSITLTGSARLVEP